MTYILILLSGILGLLGVLLETHKEVISNGKKTKVINAWGIITMLVLGIVLSISIYKHYIDDEEAKRINQENEYFKLSQVNVGPNYRLEIKATDLFFNIDVSEKYNEQIKNKAFIYNYPEYFDSASGKIGDYFDSASKVRMFAYNESDFGSNPILARINIEYGSLSGIIRFMKSGLVYNLIYLYEDIHGPPVNSADFIWPMEKRFTYNKDEIIFFGKLKRTIKAGRIYGSIMPDFKATKNDSNIEILFDKKPNEELVKSINSSLNNIKNIYYEISYDLNVDKWLIIPFEVENEYNLLKDESSLKSWKFSKKLKCKIAPYIGNLPK